MGTRTVERYDGTLDDHGVIAALSAAVYLIPTRPPNSRQLGNIVLHQSHVAVVATKASTGKDGERCASAT